MRITVLGSGTSTGIPEYRCDCATCADARRPGSPNRRTRPSIHVAVGEAHLQFDTGPNFLEQIDGCGVERIDAVIYTHAHADHIAGTNDLVMPCRKQGCDMPVYGPAETLAVLQRNFHYMFTREVFQGGGVAHLLPNVVEGPFVAADVEIVPLPVEHGAVVTNGYRIGRFAYVPDAKRIPEATLDLLRGLELLIIDSLSFNPGHTTHLSVSQALEVVRAVEPERVYLTHMMHRIDHNRFPEQCEEHGIELPENVRLSHDGLVLEV
jgi:phosphoribosyl 1,2-cyclic phosphate phosphodiesterase